MKNVGGNYIRTSISFCSELCLIAITLHQLFDLCKWVIIDQFILIVNSFLSYYLNFLHLAPVSVKNAISRRLRYNILRIWPSHSSWCFMTVIPVELSSLHLNTLSNPNTNNIVSPLNISNRLVVIIEHGEFLNVLNWKKSGFTNIK